MMDNSILGNIFVDLVDRLNKGLGFVTGGIVTILDLLLIVLGVLVFKAFNFIKGQRAINFVKGLYRKYAERRDRR